jgi:micrococcal nuclease
MRRRQVAMGRSVLIVGTLVGVSAILAALLARSAAEAPPEVGPPAPADAVAVAVVDIIDGDTFDYELADGEVLRARLFGVDTPERGGACYSEATERLRELAGDEVLLASDARLQDPNGRELRYVFTEDGISIDAVLIYEGLAVAWRADGTYRDELVALEDEAAAAGTGCLW